MNALPLIVGGVAFLLLSGKKKKRSASTNGAADDEPMDDEPMDSDDEPMDDDDDESMDDDDEPMDGEDDQADTGDGPDTEGEEEYGKVASGVRQDHIGAHPWRIRFEEDGYHAQLMMGAQQSAPMQAEIGITASLKSAKELLRDHFNDALLAAGRTEADFQEDPVETDETDETFISMTSVIHQ